MPWIKTKTFICDPRPAYARVAGQQAGEWKRAREAEGATVTVRPPMRAEEDVYICRATYDTDPDADKR